VKSFEFATGGDPVGSLTRALGAVESLLHGDSLNHVAVKHDEGCPCTTASQPMRKCTCEIVELELM
jgi:hypothetical protein